MIVYSVEDLDSFEKLKTWYVELRKYLGDSTPIIIAGNKCDLPTYTVSREAGESYAAEVGVEHKWTSAKTGKGVDDVFRTLTQSKLTRCDLQLLMHSLFRNFGSAKGNWRRRLTQT